MSCREVRARYGAMVVAVCGGRIVMERANGWKNGTLSLSLSLSLRTPCQFRTAHLLNRVLGKDLAVVVVVVVVVVAVVMMVVVVRR